uniref:T9SS type B sorting domain-containing protein n=1 Tax=Pedobacter schmidteae TaxID=2201271 RepID=UPI000EB513AC|nr:gliding motility-associated C-terminal domain-containing protein [Pedobacter schmidteae]
MKTSLRLHPSVAFSLIGKRLQQLLLLSAIQLLTLPAFAQRDDGAIAGKFNIGSGSENSVTVSWGDDLPHYSSSSPVCQNNRYHKVSAMGQSHNYGDDPNPGAFGMDVGPSRSGTVQVTYEWGSSASGCFAGWAYATISYSTIKIKAPLNLTGQFSNSPNYAIKLNWNKGTTLSEGNIQYKLKRNNVVIATLPGNQLNYEDLNITPGTSYSYSVQTIVGSSAPGDWVRDESIASNSVSVTPPAHALTATTDQNGRIRLNWASLSTMKGIESIIVYRNGQELTDLSKTSKTYSDTEIIPGVFYTYQLGLTSDGTTTIDVNGWRSGTAVGKSLPSGKLSGYIKGKTNAGVPGVVVTAVSKTALSNDEAGQPSKIYTYTGTTDADGYYEIPDIFYRDKADYVLTPQMPGYNKKRFDPETLTRKMTIDDSNVKNINFTDTASLSISGSIYFSALTDANNNQINLPLEGAEIWLNGSDSNVRSKSDGSYNVTVINGGTHQIQARFKHHNVTVAGNTQTVKTVNMTTSVTGIDFEDHQKDTLQVKVAASCNAPIGEWVSVNLNSKKTGKKTNGSPLIFNQVYKIRSNDFSANPHPNQNQPGIMTLLFPATEFQVEVSTVMEKLAPNPNKTEYFLQNYGKVDVSLSVRDTIQQVSKRNVVKVIPADTIFRPDGTIDKIHPAKTIETIVSDTARLAKLPEVNFIYRKNVRLLVNNGNPVFTDSVYFKSKGKYASLATQNDKYLANIKIQEFYEYNNVSYGCALDTGTVFIYDGVGDKDDRQEFKLDSTGVFKYQIKVGKPVLESPYQKTFQIVGKVGGRQASMIIPVIVQGERARNSTFVTKTPEVPLFVLHDPPGDKSYAKISKGTTISSSQTTQYNIGGGGGLYLDSKVGAGFDLPFIGQTGAAFHIQAEFEAGADRSKSKTTNYTLTFTEDFSTSSEETLVGNDGDVYVGSSMNMIYALTDMLYYDPAKQEMKRDTSFAADYTGFNTTFLYTEKHIQNTLIPQLKTLYSLSKSKFDNAQRAIENGDKTISKDAFEQLNKEQLENKANIDAWQFALAKNNKIRKEAKARVLPDGVPGVVNGNISFSAGAIYDNSITVDTLQSSFDELSIYVNAEVRAGIYNANGDFRETDIGGLLTIRHNKANSTETGTTSSRTVSYHLEDNDIGDFYSVALAEDRVSQTPVFRIVSGSSSCPHEDNTQYRHLPAIAVNGTSEQRNVPADQTAKFEINISNQSESDETVEYALKLDPLSNPNGAKVLVGGRDITNGVATYMIPTGKNFKLPVEVSKGPLSSTYENLAITIFSTCDNTLDDIDENNIAKPQVKLSAYFQNRCSEIDLFTPGNNWLVNQSNNNNLFVSFSKYDASTASPLTSVGLQYRKLNTDFDNTQWLTVATVPKSALVDKYYSYAFDVSGLPDGNYEIRAIAICQGVDVNYSPVYSGKIDRKSAVAFGTPSPRNGILTTADIVGVTFNKDIVLNDVSKPVTVTLKRKLDGMIIPSAVVGNGRDFEIKTVPESLMGNYENEELVATIKNLTDMSGNKVADSVTWAFVVNLSPVYWSPTNVTVNAIENQQSTFNGKLINKSASTQQISLTKYPIWLTPSIKNSNIVARGELNIDFIVNKNLNTGIYTDTVVAVVDNKKQFLYVTVNVLRTPPNWTVNPANYRYNMSVTTQFSLNNTDTLTSKDIRDKLAVFVGEECRGVANVVYDRDLNKYVAYLTAYSNEPANEAMTIHLWDTYPGLEYQAKERLTFVANGTTGSLQNPYVLHPEGVYQTIPLKKGWTWISLNVENGDMKLSKVLASLKPKEGDLIKTLAENNAYSQYSKSMGWVGKLDHINLYNSYMIYMSQPDTLRVLGNFISQAANVQLNKGWNWTGYPMAINQELTTYLKNYEPANGSQIVSQEEFAQYNSATKTWTGSLKYLRPGKGYKFYSGADGFNIPAITYTPTNDPKVEKEQQIQAPVNNPTAPVIVNNNNTTVNSTVNNTSVSTVNYENNSSVTSVINQGGTVINNTTNRYETYVYVENKLVNIVNQTTLPNGQVVGFIPVNGNATDEGKKVDIKVYDKEEKKEYTAKIEEPVKQQADQITGTVEKPVVLVLEGLADVQAVNLLEQQQVNKDDEFIYQFKLKNNGPDLAVNVVLSDTLTSSFDYLGSDNVMVFDPVKRTLRASILQLKSGEEQVFRIRLKANKVGTLAIGNGLVTANNDNNLVNNKIGALALNVIDKRANSAKILIPSLFTPNGDGMNDRFEIVGLNEFFVSNSLVIFNKNYNEVYRRQNYQNDWTGDNLPMGSYGYILKATDKDNKEVVYKGFITIVYQ